VKRARRRRVSAERAKKRRARSPAARNVLIVLSVVGGLAVVALLDRGDNAIGRWRPQHREVAAARARIGEIEARIVALETEADALRDDPVAIENAIRTDLDLARPGEWIVRDDQDRTNLRNP
jgi:cell division protein FtsB